MFQLDIKHQTIKIEGEIFTSSDFKADVIPLFASKSDFHRELYFFLKEWFSENEYISVKTSGSTGTPKEILVEKQRMIQSAMLTCSFLELKPSDKSLLCMSMQYIAGKMFTVRTLVAGLDLYLVPPCGNPLTNVNVELDFAAMVPLQVYNSLQNVEEAEKLKSIKNLIIGGGAIDETMSDQLKSFPYKIFSTYGMTETLSHIALRKLNGVDASENYLPFDSVSLSLSDENTLIIDAPLVSKDILTTNDIAEINVDGSFKILGRKDNVVNSGGLKIQIEEVERLYASYINAPFAVTSVGDEKFGEILVLVAEMNIDLDFMVHIEPAYYRAKQFFAIDKIPFTETSKIDRVAVKRLAMFYKKREQ